MRKSRGIHFSFVILLGWTCHAALGFQTGLDSLVHQARRELQPTSREVLETKRIQVRSLCQSTVDRLSQTAVDYVLALDLELPELVRLLDSPLPGTQFLETQFLETYERRLRRVVSGPEQRLIDDLREQVGELRRLAAGTEASLIGARDALDYLSNLHSTAQMRMLTDDENRQIRQSFETLQRSNLSPGTLASLQRSLSYPNLMIRVKKRAAERESRVPFTIPVHSDTCSDQTRVIANGKLDFETSACFPENLSTIPLLASVSGGGHIRADISRSSSGISASIRATGAGTQPLELTQRTVERGIPHVNVRLSSQLQSVQLAGLLNRSHLARRFVSRIAQRKLAEQDSTLARQIEEKASEKASEEGIKLANKVNSLLINNLWSRLESIDFAPSVGLSSDSVYLRSSSLYALPEQLGSLEQPPALSPDLERRIDWCALVHESAAGNLLSSLRGKTLDEATLRGIWQVQLKLTREAWELPTESHFASTITFDPVKASEFHFEDHSAKLILYLADGKLGAGSPLGASCTAHVRYRLNATKEGIQIVRDEIEFAGDMTMDQQRVWGDLLNLFLPESVSPIPRFRPSLWTQFASLEHADAQAGWLILGLKFCVDPRDLSKHNPSSGASQ